MQTMSGGEIPNVFGLWSAWDSAQSVTGLHDSLITSLWTIAAAILCVRIIYKFVTAVTGVSVGRAMTGLRLRRLAGQRLGWLRAAILSAIPTGVFVGGFVFPPLWLLLGLNVATVLAGPTRRTALERATGATVYRRKWKPGAA